MYRGIHHLGIGVKDLNKAVKFYQDVLDFELEKKLDWSDSGLKAAIFSVGETKLEFIEAINPKGEIAQSLAEAVNLKDGIVHHLCLSVSDIDETIVRLMSKGIKMINEKPIKAQGGKVAWLDRKTFEGFMIELCEEGYEIK